jgi:hypothetical protein
LENVKGWYMHGLEYNSYLDLGTRMRGYGMEYVIWDRD